MSKNKGSYLFPDTEKVGGVIFHYSKRINGSFVIEAKKNLEMTVNKLKRYKNVNLKALSEVNPIHIFIYPDIKSFRQAMGYAMQKIETKQMHGMMSQKVETRYILRDDAGSIHMVLPQGRSTSTYTTFSAVAISMIVDSYMDLSEKQSLELKNTVKRYIKSEKEKEEKAKRKEKEDKEEQEKEEQEALAEEERIQQELEEMEEKQRQQALLELNEISDEEMEEIIEAQEELQQEPDVPGWLVYGWKAYISNRLQDAKNIEKFKRMMEKGKITKPTKLKADKPSNEMDLNVAACTVEYVISVYGYGAYIELCKDPDNIKGIFYKSTTLKEDEAKEKFNNEVKEYIKQVLGRCNVVEALEVTREEVKHIKLDEEQPVKVKN